MEIAIFNKNSNLGLSKSTKSFSTHFKFYIYPVQSLFFLKISNYYLFLIIIFVFYDKY